jgi:hypothetical protein
MYIELRKNGTFYLKDSVYNPETKLPQNTSIYLGSNALQAKEKLKALTADPALLAQIPDVKLYEIELDRALKSLQKLNCLETPGLTRLITEYVSELATARQFLTSARQGLVIQTADCPGCLFKAGNHCHHFEQNFTQPAGKPADGKAVRCLAYEPGPKRLHTGSIKLPRHFRTQ